MADTSFQRGRQRAATDLEKWEEVGYLSRMDACRGLRRRQEAELANLRSILQRKDLSTEQRELQENNLHFQQGYLSRLKEER